MKPSVEKTLARIKDTVESGAYYEAQQMYKTSYHRCKARQQLDDAATILQEGAVTQLSHGQATCGVELGMLLVEAYMSAGTPAESDSVGRVLAILRAFPPPDRTAADAGQEKAASSAAASASVSSRGGVTAPVVDEYARLVATAIKWASKSGAVLSARRIHSAFASYLWRSFGAEGIGRALLHFVRGEDAEEFAEALHSCAQQGPPGEVDLWLLRAVLQVLSAATSHSRMAQLAHARALYDAFVARSPPLDTPTAHFTELVLLALEHVALSPRAHDMFVLARERYSDGVLRRDDCLGPLLERAEALYFNVRRGGGGMGGALGGLLGDLFKTLTEAQ
ncbi:hypothetical protein PLESTB_001210200 [Pleodorina starrii]|uniref:Golgi to ER traffic protein 4 n=1 Tax=Pleodorina starrii TaxID=330485 RepID=A0A9W6BSA3_9CHLO|nr:hypothetical protein PLESTM_001648900 [Pleodorina starrii]GLC57309.1 hypothetical protein PLESTB_001210200 [Pleodorina starrii]GLC71292.1 hypothetical protein PLESTF_001099800 [Pleodorina starrii]